MWKPRWQIIADFINANEYKYIAEVGVNKCETAARVLSLGPGIVNYNLVDINKTPEIENMVQNASRVRFYNLSSEGAALCFADESLDLVFIDAEHSEDAVGDDIINWFPKVCVGGILCGHDYHRVGKVPGNGVKRAVDTVLRKVNLISDECDNSDRCVWWVIKTGVSDHV